MSLKVNFLNYLPAALGQYPTQVPLKKDREAAVSVEIDKSKIGSSVFNAFNRDLILVTSSNLTCLDNLRRVRWQKPINNRLNSSVEYNSEKSEILLFDNGELCILDEQGHAISKMQKLHKSELKSDQTYVLKALSSKELVIVALRNNAGVTICGLDPNLNQKWSYPLEMTGEFQLVEMKNLIVIIQNKQIALLNRNGEKIDHNFDEFKYSIQFVLKLTEDQLLLCAGQDCYILDINAKKQVEQFKISKRLKGSPSLLLDHHRDWRGFVSPLEPEHIKYGIYQYGIAVFDKQGNCTSTIYDEQPLQYLLVDANNVIIALFGPSIEVFENIGSYTDQIGYYIRLFKDNGEEIEKISIPRDHFPLVGPMTVTADGHIACFSNGCLRLYSPQVLEPSPRVVSSPAGVQITDKETFDRTPKIASQITYATIKRDFKSGAGTPKVAAYRVSHQALIEHVYNPDEFYISNSTPYQEEREIAFTNTPLPQKENLKWSHNPQVKLEIRVKDKTYSSHGTLVGPLHILTSCTPLYDSQQKIWADEILVSSAKAYPVVKVYTFSAWTQKQNPHYNIALLILGKAIGKHTGWSGMLSIPDSFLQDERVHVLKAQHNVQKVEPDEIRCTPKSHADQTGAALSANHWKTSMVLGLVTLDRDHTPLALRFSKQKIEAVARIISENFKPISRFAFGKAHWNKYFGDVGEEPPLPANIKEILNAQCPIWPDKKVYETHLLTLIPKTVNGQPLTLKTLEALVQKPFQGPPSKFQYLSLGQSQDVPPEHSYWTLLSRDVIPGSRNKSYDNQQELVQKYPGYEVPHVLDTAVALFMEHVRSGVRLYSYAPWTYTRCQEKYSDRWQLVVGGFAVGGLRVDNHYSHGREPDGVGVARKFY